MSLSPRHSSQPAVRPPLCYPNCMQHLGLDIEWRPWLS
ncbi:Protein of unknown function [Pyronema omphalodes CBS 100304]|uniref:Uncharacterized protein n=1 Tax=Pyronema omphalodes (strain CBS 100304) TaxID=1076935 RepID=U4L0L1_PYROM|nr:Protein of unknown function [Pyronema omphalodes CBS 100304]